MIAAATPSAFWFLTRGTGAVTLVLLTITVALGVANVRRTQFAHLPRFVTDALHRNASLLAVSFLFVHVATALLDGFAPITLLDVVIPFGSAYRPVWLGFGAVALDLLIALTITSLLRRRIGYRGWRATHWLAYASWPVALLHGLGTGTDTKTHWMLLLCAGCVGIMGVAVLARVSSGWPRHLGVRVSALAAAGLTPLGLAVWLPAGPLARDWARQAGTPSSLLAAAHSTSTPAGGAAGPIFVGSGSPPHGEQAENEASFSAAVDGNVSQTRTADGQTVIDIALRASGQRLSTLHIWIQGSSLGAGGVQMNSSRVTLGSISDPSQYGGRVTALEGSSIRADVSSPGYAAFALLTRLHLPSGSGAATGTLVARAREGEH